MFGVCVCVSQEWLGYRGPPTQHVALHLQHKTFTLGQKQVRTHQNPSLPRALKE